MKALWRFSVRFLAGLLAAGYLLFPSALIYAASPPPTCIILVNPSSISVGGSVTVKWQSTNATAGAITNIGNVGPSGSINLLPSSAGATYFGAFTGPGGTANCQAHVAVTTSGGTTDTTNAPTPVVATQTQTPVAAQGSGLVPCGYGTYNGNGLDQGASTGCQACNLAQLIQNVINFLIGISIPIAAALFAYAGWLYFTSAAKPGNISTAKKIFSDAFLGFALAISAWLIVNTFLHVIFSQGAFANGSWFTIQCDTANRVVNGNIGSLLSQIPILSGGAVQGNGNIYTNGSPTVSGGGGNGATSGINTGTSLDNAVYDGYDQALSTLQSSCDASGNPNSYSCYGLQSMKDSGAITDSAVEALQDACDNGDSSSCSAAKVASAVVGDNYDKVKATLDTSCNAGNSGSCDGLASLQKSGSVTDSAYEALLSSCEDNNESSSCNVLQTIVPGTPSQVGKGDCSPSTLSDTWGSNASVMSCIAQGESSCIANRPSSTDHGADGNAFSYGLYQINLTAGVDRNGNMIASDPHNLNIPSCMATNNGQPLNCSQAYTGTNYQSKVVNQSIYQSCVNAASNVQCNTDAANALFNQVQSRAGTAAAYMQWGAYKDNHCGG